MSGFRPPSRNLSNATLLVAGENGIGNLHLAGHWGDTGGGVLAAVYAGMRVAARILTAAT